MQAYLFIGNDISCLNAEVSNLAKKLKAKILEFPIVKIEDVRNLNNLLRLSFDKPTLIFCPNIHETGEEGLNAFLKNLEEPQENIFFALSAPTTKKVLPTIVSRCQIVKTTNDKLQITNDVWEEIEKFFKMKTGERFSYIDKIRDRQAAIEFIENTIAFMHQMLHFDGSLHKNALKCNFRMDDVKLALKTLSGLYAYGNVNLQLSNFVINLG